jgi:hypothetical protein
VRRRSAAPSSPMRSEPRSRRPSRDARAGRRRRTFRRQPRSSGATPALDVVVSPIARVRRSARRSSRVARITDHAAPRKRCARARERFRSMADEPRHDLRPTAGRPVPQRQPTALAGEHRIARGGAGLGSAMPSRPPPVGPRSGAIDAQRPTAALHGRISLPPADGTYAHVSDEAAPRQGTTLATPRLRGLGPGHLPRLREAEARQRRSSSTNSTAVKNTARHRAGHRSRRSPSPGRVDVPVSRGFEGRLLALSRAHDVLTQESWRARTARVARQPSLPAAGARRAPRASAPGCACASPRPRARHGRSRARHQRRKYGALSCRARRVTGSRRATGPARRLRLTWRKARALRSPPSRAASHAPRAGLAQPTRSKGPSP